MACLFKVVLVVVTVAVYQLMHPQVAADVVFDDSLGYGRTFDGIGGLSGGGATSKLLVNYPQEQRDQILDYLFKPNFGASLQILKVEIGGDAQSTDGTEASHMHNSWEENYTRGYEWWLMVEAKKRNPNIKLYGLPWGFPGWIGQGTRSPFANPMILADYIVRWISGAKIHYNLTIDYIGIWNEKSYDITYIKTLRSVLDQRGFQNVMIIAADKKWEIAADIKKDPELADIIYAIGCHYPGTLSSSDAVSTGKKLWASEDYSTFNDEIGAGCWARILNQNYVNGLMTSTISWNLIGSYYKGLPYYRDGLMTAVEPWSGNYVVQSPIWVSAHITQFSSIGWKYLSHGSGVGKLPNGGSYVGLFSPDGVNLTIVIETMTHDHSVCIRPRLPKYTVTEQNITITLKGHFAQITQMNVWYSKLSFNGTPSEMFVKQSSKTIINGQVNLSLGLDEIVTLTSLPGGQKGSYPEPPASKPFPLPYNDNFEDYTLSQEPFLLTPQTGSLDVVKSQNISHGLVSRQTVLHPPIKWCPNTLSFPYAVIGDQNWTDLFIEIDFEIPGVNATDGVFVAARVTEGGCQAFIAHGIYFFAFSNSKYIVANDLARTKVLNQGNLPPGQGWHKLSLLVQGQKAIGAYDEKGIFNIDIPSYPSSGFAGIGTDNFGIADFDNLHIATQQDGQAKMKEYFSHSLSQPLYFSKEERN
uniref:galactosylceramidase n=1 Tax=Arion vulgaris TaxID=1028688 RepID=A0A0B7AEQ2_9EUPU